MPVSANPPMIDRTDPRFDLLKKGNNARFPDSAVPPPSKIAVCADGAECAAALQQIVAAGLRPTVKSGGHGYEDFWQNNPGGAIIDLSTHDTVDKGKYGYRVGAGTMLGVAYAQLYKKYGVTMPGGSCYSVGAGGHISGGGYGVLSRLFGLTSDWVTSMDIVTVDAHGKVIERHIDKDHDADLFRACRGAGGGNYGIITDFYFEKLPTAPSQVADAGVSFAWSDLTEAKFTKLLVTYGDYLEGRGKDKDTWGLFTMMGVSPAAGPQARIGVHVQFCNLDGTTNDLSVLHEFFDSFKDLNPQPNAGGGGGGRNGQMMAPVLQNKEGRPYDVSKRHWYDATVAGGVGGGGSRGKYKSAYMKKSFSPEECAAVFKFMKSPSAGAMGSVMAVDSYGGAVNDTARLADTSCSQRASVMKLQYQCYWRDKEQDASHLKYMDDLYTAIYTGPQVAPEYQGTPMGPRFEGCYMNYSDADMLRYKFWPELFYGTGELYPFLIAVKKKYDPNNVFHSSMSVRA
jgi:FAD/FMN-containing dehydrogenase